MRLKNMVAVVTSGGTGLGEEIARRYVYEGAKLVATDIVGTNLLPEDDNYLPIEADVSDASSVFAMIAAAHKKFGGVDILVNNAAISSALTPKPFETISAEEFHRVLAVNTAGPFFCAQAVSPLMRSQRSGSIINIASATVYKGTPNNAQYVASKGAVVAMTRSLARELGTDNIRVNAIAPGLTLTAGIAANPAYNLTFWNNINSARCIQRDQLPEDIVGAAVFLASNEAAFITGQVLTVDGGSTFH